MDGAALISTLIGVSIIVIAVGLTGIYDALISIRDELKKIREQGR
jgi:hypothetical protein